MFFCLFFFFGGGGLFCFLYISSVLVFLVFVLFLHVEYVLLNAPLVNL